MQRPNWFDERFEEQYKICGNSTDKEKVDAALAVIVNSPLVRNRVQDVIEAAEKRQRDAEAGGPLVIGGSLSQMIRQGVAEVLNAEILEN